MMMNIAKKEREELNALSKEVFGSASRWHKSITNGYTELLTEEVTETIPAEKEGEEPTKRQVQAPVLKNGSRQFVTKYHTVESVREYMITAKTKLEEIRAEIKKQQEVKEAEERAKKLHDELSGSAK